VRIVGSLDFVANLFRSSRKCFPYSLGFSVKSTSSAFKLWLVMCVWSLAVSSFVIGKGGRGLHPFVIRAVMVFWSGCVSLTRSPFSPVISIGLKPVWWDMLSLMDSSPFAEEISISIFSSVGGCTHFSSGV